jgi:hypothetical protein
MEMSLLAHFGNNFVGARWTDLRYSVALLLLCSGSCAPTRSCVLAFKSVTSCSGQNGGHSVWHSSSTGSSHIVFIYPLDVAHIYSAPYITEYAPTSATQTSPA